MGRYLAAAVHVALLIVASPGIAAAQEALNYGSVSGRVVDANGGVVPGTTVTARHTATNVTREATTDAEGRFRFPYLSIGAYELTARLAGFKDARRPLALTVGSAFDVTLTLQLATLNETVTIVEEAPILETARSQIAGTVSREEVESVPLNGRQFLDLALLIPGVSPTNTGSTQLFAETSAVPGQGLSIGSQRNFSNNFIVDGLSANDDAAGLSGMPYGVDAVDQFQVVTSGGQAELGRALGGYINVVTKSGTNTRLGNLYGYFRDDSLNAANALLGKALPMNQKQYGFSLGGPIAVDRAFYFLNFEQRRLDQSGLTTISDSNLQSINARLGAVAYPGMVVATGIYANPVDTTNLLAKVDHQLNNRDLFTARYSLYRAGSANSRGAGGLSAPSASSGLANTDQSVALSNTLTLSNRTVNETRIQAVSSDLSAPPTDAIGPNVAIAGVATFGTLSSSPTARLNRMYQLVSSLSHLAGAHALRAGADFIYNDDRITFPRSFRGSYGFSSLDNFLAGAYNNAGFTQTFGESQVSQSNPNLGLYVQDEWRASRELTLNAGLRYDLQFLETINTDTNNVSPRAGVVWAPERAPQTLVRASAGLFFDRVPLRALANALLSAGNTADVPNLRQVNVSLSPGQDVAPAFPAILAAPVPSVTLPNFTTMDRNLQNAYSRQASVEVEHQLGHRSTVSAGFQYVSGRNLIVQINQNVPTCVASGSNNGCRPNPAYANNNRYSSEAESVYKGLHISLVQRPSWWGSYRMSYTYSRSMNNVGESFFSSPIDPTDLSKDWGRSDDDQRHRLVVNGTLNTPDGPGQTFGQRLSHGWQLSMIVQSYSALPFNITSGVTTVQGTAGRPVVNGEYIERNAGVGSEFFTLNARLSRAFQLGAGATFEALAEAFNVTNHVNVLTRNTVFGTGAYPTNPLPTFQQVTAVADPRVFQVGLRLRF